MENEDKLILDFMKRVSSTSKINNNTQYQYSYVDLEFVISNPNEYIIPQCLPACKILWDKNIETFMVSNNEDDDLYILLTNISKENKILLEYLTKIDSRYYYSEYRNTYGIKVKGKNESAIQELISLTSCLQMQDTLRFTSSEKFLEEFRTTGGEMKIDEYGHIIRQENPEFVNISLEEALKKTGKEYLYVRQENRIYESTMYLLWHQRYLNFLKQAMKGQTSSSLSDIQIIKQFNDSSPKL